MPGYGYGDQPSQRSRRRDESSDSRTRDRKRKREREEKKDRKQDSSRGGGGRGGDSKRHRNDEPLDHQHHSDRRRDGGSQGGRDGHHDGREDHRRDHRAGKDDDSRRQRPRGGDDPLGVEDPSQKKDGKLPAYVAPARNWRDEMNEEAEDQRDLSDDEETTARKIEESRKRREQMMEEAKKKREEMVSNWVNKGEEDESQTTPCRTQNSKADGGEGESSDEGGDGGDKAEDEEEDEEAKEAKRKVQQFVLDSKRKEEEKASGDMFNESAEAAEALKKKDGNKAQAIGLTGASGDDWDDEDGYYLAKIGEVMGERYLVVENVCGKGVFSTVVKAKDQQDREQGLVAIKVMRCNDMMKKAAEKEIEILEKLGKADKGNKRHVIRLFTLKKYTKNKGMSLQAVRAYTKQLLVGLRHIHKCKLIHADIKPDNVLISEGHNMVKLCDLGTALEVKDVAVSPYLVSRFYRSPEIVLGCLYDQACDIFALGATLYELFTGKILLQSKTNNDHLRRIMEIKGKIPKHVIKKGILWKQHFDENLDFQFKDVDKATNEEVTRTLTDLGQKKHIADMIMERVGPEKRNSQVVSEQQYVKRAKQFSDLLEQMLVLDPDKRITANDALNHQFVADSQPGSKGAPGHDGSKPARDGAAKGGSKPPAAGRK